MEQRQRNSPTYPIKFQLIASYDKTTGLAGASPSVTIRKEGGNEVAATATVAELSNGWYWLAGDNLAGDLDTLGDLIVEVTAAGADPRSFKIQVVGYDPFTSVRTLDLTQAITDTQAATVGGALNGSWATAWGRAAKDIAGKHLKLWGAGNATGTPSATFTLDDGANPTTRTPQ